MIEKPESALITKTAQVLQAGKTYEHTIKRDYHDDEVTLFKVEDINYPLKELRVSLVVGDSRDLPKSEYDSEKDLYKIKVLAVSDDIKEVNYSDSELEKKKFLAKKEIKAEDISLISKDIFNEASTEISKKIATGSSFLAISPSGDFEVITTNYYGDKLPDDYKLAYPEKSNEVLKRQVAERYLSEKRRTYGGYVSWVESIVKPLFGEDWKKEIEKHKTKASKEEALDLIDKYYKSKKAEVDKSQLEKSGQSAMYHAYTIAVKDGWSGTVKTKDLVFSRLTRDKPWDNMDDAREWIDGYSSGVYRKAEEEQKRIEAEREAERIAKLRQTRLDGSKTETKNDTDLVNDFLIKSGFSAKKYWRDKLISKRILANELEKKSLITKEEKERVRSLSADNETKALTALIEFAVERKIESTKKEKNPIETARKHLAAVNIEIYQPEKGTKYKKAGNKRFTSTVDGDIFLHDSSPNPYDGFLFKAKNDLKEKYKAFFTKDVQHDDFKGSWWVITGNEEPDDIASTILPSEEEIDMMEKASKANVDAPKKLLIPDSINVGDVVNEEKGWIVTGKSNSSWWANSRSLTMNEEQEVQFDIDIDDDVTYAYFN